MSDDMLFQTILDRLDRFEDKLDKHIEKDSSVIRSAIKAIIQYAMPFILVLALNSGTNTKVNPIESLNNAASSTLVAKMHAKDSTKVYREFR